MQSGSHSHGWPEFPSCCVGSVLGCWFWATLKAVIFFWKNAEKCFKTVSSTWRMLHRRIQVCKGPKGCSEKSSALRRWIDGHLQPFHCKTLNLWRFNVRWAHTFPARELPKNCTCTWGLRLHATATLDSLYICTLMCFCGEKRLQQYQQQMLLKISLNHPSSNFFLQNGFKSYRLSLPPFLLRFPTPIVVLKRVNIVLASPAKAVCASTCQMRRCPPSCLAWQTR